MKTKYIFIVALALGLASCEKDFFSTNSPSAMGNSVFKSTLTTEQAIGGIYNIFGEDKSFRNRLCGGYSALNTDIEYINKGSGHPYESAIYNMSKGTGDLSTADGKDPWGNLNVAIERCNVVIDGMRKYSDLKNEDFQYLLGEALCLRAFCCLEMVKLWGDIPACFTSFDGQDVNDLYVKKQDRNVTFEQIRKDLNEAASLMPWSSGCPGMAANNVGRPSKAFALALLSRADMMYAGLAMRPNTFVEGGTSDCSVQYNVKDAAKRQELYQEVVSSCAEIIKNEISLSTFAEDYPFDATFKGLCADVTNYSKTEFIWVIPFLNGARGQVLCLNGLKMDPSCAGIMINTEDGDSKTVQTKVQGMIRIVPTFWWDFEPGDKRRDVTVCPFSWKYDNGSGVSSNPSVFPYDASSDKKMFQQLSTTTDMNLGKFRVEWMVRKYNVNEDAVDMPVIRYADVMLMYAEAAIGSLEGNAPADMCGLTPQEVYDAVRKRAGLESKPLTMDNIIKERAFEFCGENIRKYDLMRWGKLGSQLRATMDRLQDLSNGTGEFAGRMDSICFKYKLSAEKLAQRGNCYVLDSIYGLNKGDVKPATFNKENGWVMKAFYDKDDVKLLLPSKYFLFKEGVDPDMHQYWPIFQVNLDASHGTLWNDYGY